MDGEGVYWIGYRISFVLIFLGSWMYCIYSYGFLVGVGLGWLPSAIAAVLLAFFWPVVVLGIIFFLWLLLH